MASGTGTQVFMLNKSSAGGKLFRVVLHLVLGFVAWFVLTMILVSILERVVGPVGQSVAAGLIIALFLFSGIIVVPLCVFLRWYVAVDLSIALDSEIGMTLTRQSRRRGEQVTRYDWQDVTATHMTAIASSGMNPVYTFHLYTLGGEELKIPPSMEGFDYFVDMVNRSATHLPYEWQYLNYPEAQAQGTDRGWGQVSRKRR